MACRKCGKDVTTSLCVDCFADEVRESRKRTADEIISEITGIIVAHLETMPEPERYERMAAFRDTVQERSRIRENRFGGSLIELGVLHALFEEIPASEIGVTSGAQNAFDAARQFIREMVTSQCKLAGCKLSGKPYGKDDEHTDECWFGIRRNFYRDRAAKHPRTASN